MRDLGGERSAASDEDILSEGAGARGGTMATRRGLLQRPQGMRRAHFTARRETQGDIRGGAVFDTRLSRLGMKEGMHTQENKKGLRSERHHKVI